MTVAPPEPADPVEDEPDNPKEPDLPDPAFPEVLPGGDPGPGSVPDADPETQPAPE
jgi:hypothetical protein